MTDRPQDTADRTSSDPPAAHGMAVVGQQTVFLSHLPEFEGPHNYQAILEITLASPGGDPFQVYAKDREKNPQEKLYTFEPKAFVLPDLFPKAGREAVLKSIRGNIYRGHFERFQNQQAKEKARILRDVIVNINNVVHAHKFIPGAKEIDTLEYILFGKGQELFLAHFITKPPDFDQILSVQVAGHQLTDAELRRGVHVRVAGRTNSATDRITERQDQISATLHVGDQNIPVKIKTGSQFYFEEGELSA